MQPVAIPRAESPCGLKARVRTGNNYTQSKLPVIWDVYHISSNISQVSNTSRVSNTSWRSDCISYNTSRGVTANTIGLMVLIHTTVVCCVIHDVLRYVSVNDYGI